MPDEPRNLAILDEDVQFVITSGADAVRQGLNRALGVPPLSLLSREDRSTAEIVLAEVFNNIVEHAYAGRDGSIRVWLSLDDRGLTCRIEDEGRPMPGGQAPAGRPPDPRTCPKAALAGT
jgi:serine/threonine-protein kinase RsbW